MFTNRQVLDFCNLQMTYFAADYKISENNVNLVKLANNFIFQHAMEEEVTVGQALDAVSQWWAESTFNPDAGIKRKKTI